MKAPVKNTPCCECPYLILKGEDASLITLPVVGQLVHIRRYCDRYRFHERPKEHWVEFKDGHWRPAWDKAAEWRKYGCAVGLDDFLKAVTCTELVKGLPRFTGKVRLWPEFWEPSGDEDMEEHDKLLVETVEAGQDNSPQPWVLTPEQLELEKLQDGKKKDSIKVRSVWRRRWNLVYKGRHVSKEDLLLSAEQSLAWERHDGSQRRPYPKFEPRYRWHRLGVVSQKQASLVYWLPYLGKPFTVADQHFKPQSLRAWPSNQEFLQFIEGLEKGFLPLYLHSSWGYNLKTERYRAFPRQHCGTVQENSLLYPERRVQPNLRFPLVNIHGWFYAPDVSDVHWNSKDDWREWEQQHREFEWTRLRPLVGSSLHGGLPWKEVEWGTLREPKRPWLLANVYNKPWGLQVDKHRRFTRPMPGDEMLVRRVDRNPWKAKYTEERQQPRDFMAKFRPGQAYLVNDRFVVWDTEALPRDIDERYLHLAVPDTTGGLVWSGYKVKLDNKHREAGWEPAKESVYQNQDEIWGRMAKHEAEAFVLHSGLGWRVEPPYSSTRIRISKQEKVYVTPPKRSSYDVFLLEQWPARICDQCLGKPAHSIHLTAEDKSEIQANAEFILKARSNYRFDHEVPKPPLPHLLPAAEQAAVIWTPKLYRCCNTHKKGRRCGMPLLPVFECERKWIWVNNEMKLTLFQQRNRHNGSMAWRGRPPRWKRRYEREQLWFPARRMIRTEDWIKHVESKWIEEYLPRNGIFFSDYMREGLDPAEWT